MSFDNMLKGLQAFQEGVQQYATSNALLDANKQLAEINTTIEDQGQKQLAMNQMAFSLANRLGAAGADAATIDATASRMGVSAAAERQISAQEAMSAQNLDLQRQEGALDRSWQRERFYTELGANSGQDVDPWKLDYDLPMEKVPPKARELWVPGIGPVASKEEAAKLRTEGSEMWGSIKIIDEIMQKSKQMNRFAPRSKERSEIQSQLASLAGRIRVPLTGPGPLTDQEYARLRDTIGDPTKTLRSFRGQENELAKLMTVRKILAGNREATQIAHGLDPMRSRTNRAIQWAEQNPDHPQAQRMLEKGKRLAEQWQRNR